MPFDEGHYFPLVEGWGAGKLTRREPGDPLVNAHPAGNPCVAVFGAGPDGATCATCEHLHAIAYSKTYFKCDQRPRSGGAGTDHRMRWPACARYTLREGHVEKVWGST